jgi:hypothetical protein
MIYVSHIVNFAILYRKKYDIAILQQPENRRAFSIELKNRFQVLEEMDGMEEIWNGMRSGYTETAIKILGS